MGIRSLKETKNGNQIVKEDYKWMILKISNHKQTLTLHYIHYIKTYIFVFIIFSSNIWKFAYGVFF